MSNFDSIIAELDAIFAPKPKATSRKPQAIEPRPEPQFWIPTAVVLTRHSWQCQCGASEEGTPSLFVREQKGRATRLRRCGRDNYPQLPHVLEHLEPEAIDTCPYCFTESTADDRQLRFPFEEDLAPFIQAVSKTFEELHTERLADAARGLAALKSGLSTDSLQPDLYEQPEPFAIDFIIGERHSIHFTGCGPANRHLDDEATEQAVALARRGLIDLL
jgi:hypothetical protein